VGLSVSRANDARIKDANSVVGGRRSDTAIERADAVHGFCKMHDVAIQKQSLKKIHSAFDSMGISYPSAVCPLVEVVWKFCYGLCVCHPNH